MPVTVFDPMSVELGPIGATMADRVDNEDLKAFFRSKDDIDGNLSAIVVGNSDAVGVGVGTWTPGQRTDAPIPLMYDEVLFVVEGEFDIEIDGKLKRVQEGEVAHLSAKQMVTIGSEKGCRLVWISSPPTWKAFEAAWDAGLIPKT